VQTADGHRRVYRGDNPARKGEADGEHHAKVSLPRRRAGACDTGGVRREAEAASVAARLGPRLRLRGRGLGARLLVLASLDVGVRCATPKRSISVSAQLTRDGIPTPVLPAGAEGRTCANVAEWFVGCDLFSLDNHPEPVTGDQLYCASGTGLVGGTVLGPARLARMTPGSGPLASGCVAALGGLRVRTVVACVGIASLAATLLDT
jgi:hypothetical protein